MSSSNSPETDSVGDPGDDSSYAVASSPAPNEDGGLTIRIPNPKMYMARASQWKGRRGKPRCDHCRLNNLKCDRVLPQCNHCSWANGRECKYTPLPTPAHRGIPRCDRCRIKNMKCDRNLPICNHCAEEDGGTECNYTPKKRHKVPEDHAGMREGGSPSPYASKTASFLISDMPTSEDMGDDEKPYSRDDSQDGDDADNDRGTPSNYRRSGKLLPLAPKSSPFASPLPSGGRSCFLGERSILVPPRIESWSNSAFAPLPDTILHHLRTANAMEMPNRQAFDEALAKFFLDLAPDLRETAAFPPDAYGEIASAVSKGDMSSLSNRRQMWVQCHHIRSGSQKYHLLLLPRDAYFHIDRADEEKLRLEYIARMDGTKPPLDLSEGSPNKATGEISLPSMEWTMAYERIPVQTQIYDVLVYAHRSHGSASSMLFEARRVGIATITWPMVEMFTRLCPLCNLRAKTGGQTLPLTDPVRH